MTSTVYIMTPDVLSLDVFSDFKQIRFTICSEQLMELFPCRARRRFARGLKRKPMALMKRLRKAKKEAPALEKPEVCLIVVVMHMRYLYSRAHDCVDYQWICSGCSSIF